jgi:hypothetical protein
MKTWAKNNVLLLILLGGLAMSFLIMTGLTEVAEARADVPVLSEAPPRYTALQTAPAPEVTVVGISNPADWPWESILLWAFTILGALLAALRPIARLTKWTFDDKVVVRLEWLMALLLKVFTPPGARLASLGGGKSPGDPPRPPLVADNVKFPPGGVRPA